MGSFSGYENDYLYLVKKKNRTSWDSVQREYFENANGKSHISPCCLQYTLMK